MKARLIYHVKEITLNGDILEIKIWRIPKSKDKRTASNILEPIFAGARGFSGMITRKEREITSMLEIERYRISSRVWISFLQIFTGT